MEKVKRMLLWLVAAIACFLPASALTPSAPENRIWEIFSTGYDAATTETTDTCNRTETPTSDYDTASIHSRATEGKPSEANNAFFGQSAEFKALDRGGKLTKAGRALDKHGIRPGSAFPQATGSVAAKNAQGQQVLSEIIQSNQQVIRGNRFGGRDIFDSNTMRGVRYDANGNMMGFLEGIRQ
jgi:hypothetical protein